MSDIPKTPSLNTQLANAVAAVARAQDHLRLMSERVALARREETEALNKVNEEQRHFDALVAEVKKSAPRDTEWRRPVSHAAACDAQREGQWRPAQRGVNCTDWFSQFDRRT